MYTWPFVWEGIALTNILEMRGITKIFPGVVANDNINLQIRQGEIHALLGENGAGKSTLMNILYGLYEPEKGEILFKGAPIRLRSPADAISRGIGMVHQHFMLVPPFTVAENIMLGAEATRGLSLDRRAVVRKVQDLSAKYGLRVDPTAKVEEISVGQQQRVEILKALYRGAELLILDEPTAVLTPQEITELISVMRALVDQGKTIIFITHKLKEVLRIADRVTVIRRGKTIETRETAGATPDELAALMVGRNVSLQVAKTPSNPREDLLKVEQLSARSNRGLPALREASLTVRAGEIVGICGVDGNGQTELVETITGLRKATGGRVMLNQAEITRWTVSQRTEAGLAHVPEDRQQRGLVLDFTVAENSVLGRHRRSPYSRSGWLALDAIAKTAQRLIGEFDIRPPLPDVAARGLSGGNQQKIIVARELDRKPKVLVASQPTRGLDVGAIESIHKRIVEHRDQGGGVLLVSLELDEILSLSDRILVIYEGQIVAEVRPEETSEEELGLLMAGGKGGMPR